MHLTLRQLGALIEVPHQTLDALETGASQVPLVDVAGKLAAALRCKLVMLTTKTGIHMVLEPWP
jgi:DNA-binding XRE family transcriptional regulator